MFKDSQTYISIATYTTHLQSSAERPQLFQSITDTVSISEYLKVSQTQNDKHHVPFLVTVAFVHVFMPTTQ